MASLDMWEPYVQSIQAHLPDAEEKMVFDKFHVAKHMSKATPAIHPFCSSVSVGQKPSRLDCLRSFATYNTRPRARSLTSVRYLCPFFRLTSSMPRTWSGRRRRLAKPHATTRRMMLPTVFQFRCIARRAWEWLCVRLLAV